jgi:hypothetical protein
MMRQRFNWGIPDGFGDVPPDRSWSRGRSRSKTRSTVPVLVAQRRASIWLALATSHQAPAPPHL